MSASLNLIWNRAKTNPISTLLVASAFTCYVYGAGDAFARLATSFDLGMAGFTVEQQFERKLRSSKSRQPALPYLRRSTSPSPTLLMPTKPKQIDGNPNKKQN